MLELPGISLLDRKLSDNFAEDDYQDRVREVVAKPVADLMDRTAAVTDLVPLFTLCPEWATLRLRNYLRPRGYELPIAE